MELAMRCRRRFPLRNPALLLLAACLAAAVLSHARAADGVRDEGGIEYTVSFDPLPEDAAVADAIREISRLRELQKEKVASLIGLQRRVDEDVEKITSLLRSKGYYSARVAAKIDTAATPVAVTVSADSGPVYPIAGIEISNADGTGPPEPIGVSHKSLGIELDAPGESAAIASAKPRLLRTLEDRSFAYAKVVSQRVVVDHDKPGVFVRMTIDTGPPVRFGTVSVEGNRSVDTRFILRRVAWKSGEAYSREKVDATRQTLSETGLFTGVAVTKAETPAPDGTVPMKIAVVERKKQTIGGGVRYSTADGPGARAFWTHRNLFGAGERAAVTAEGASDTAGAAVEYFRPDLFSVKNTAVSKLRFSQEEPDGYRSTEVEASQRIERAFNDQYRGSAGVTVERADIDDAGAQRIFVLLSLPATLRRDTSNDLLNPTRGGRTTLSVTPYVDWFGAAPDFTVAQIHDATYLPLDTDGRYTIAVWARAATLVGQSTADVPANKRLYSGGPGSVRAFALNHVGPLDAAGDPVGGRSLTDAGIEARIRVYGDFAVVPFIEGGGVYDATFPRLGKDIQWGGGLGLRYHTAIGPIRLDAAFPFNRRQGDDAFQVLISLGQAF